jgi:hypothetical protein
LAMPVRRGWFKVDICIHSRHRVQASRYGTGPDMQKRYWMVS